MKKAVGIVCLICGILDLWSQTLCRRTKDGVVILSNSSRCPRGTRSIEKVFGGVNVRENGITSTHIADGTVTDSDISPLANISWSKINTEGAALPFTAITGVNIKNSDIALDANISGSKIAPNSLPWDRIQSNTLSISGGPGNPLVDNTVESVDIKDNTITDADISTNANISWSKINTSGASLPFSAISGVSINDSHISSISGFKIAPNSIPWDRIQAGSISVSGGTGGSIADGTIESVDIKDGTITNANIAANAGIAHAKLDFTGWTAPANSVGSDQLKDDAVTTAKIKDGAVTAAKLAPEAVSGGAGGVIKDGTITDDDIAANANIAATKLAPNSITAAQLADDAVETNEIKNGAITTEKIADKAVSKRKLDIDFDDLPYVVLVGGTRGDLPEIDEGETVYYPISGVSDKSESPEDVDLMLTYACPLNTKVVEFKVGLRNVPESGVRRFFLVDSFQHDEDNSGIVPGSIIELEEGEDFGRVVIQFHEGEFIGSLAVGTEVEGTPDPNSARWVFKCM